MLKILLTPLSYILGLIISHITKEEIMIRKKWFNNWPYLLILMPLALLVNSDLGVIVISLVNYAKASKDYLKKVGMKKVLVENLLFILATIVVINL